MQQRWHPMIPIDKTDKNEELISRLKENGISPEAFLTAYGERDITGEKARIQEWAEWQAELEAKKMPIGEDNANPNQNKPK